MVNRENLKKSFYLLNKEENTIADFTSRMTKVSEKLLKLKTSQIKAENKKKQLELNKKTLTFHYKNKHGLAFRKEKGKFELKLGNLGLISVKEGKVNFMKLEGLHQTTANWIESEIKNKKSRGVALLFAKMKIGSN